MSKHATMDHIIGTLNRRDEVGRFAVTVAIVRIYQRQTADERCDGSTRHTNGVGFSASDARLGTYMAKWALGPRNTTGNPVRMFTGKWLEKGRKMALKYRKQLLEIASQKEHAKQRAAEQRRLAEERKAAAEQARMNAEHSAHIINMLASEEEPPTIRMHAA